METPRERIAADTVGILLTLQGMAFSALWGASQVNGMLAAVGYLLAASLFVFMLVLQVMATEEK